MGIERTMRAPLLAFKSTPAPHLRGYGITEFTSSWGDTFQSLLDGLNACGEQRRNKGVFYIPNFKSLIAIDKWAICKQYDARCGVVIDGLFVEVGLKRACEAMQACRTRVLIFWNLKTYDHLLDKVDVLLKNLYRSKWTVTSMCKYFTFSQLNMLYERCQEIVQARERATIRGQITRLTRFKYSNHPSPTLHLRILSLCGFQHSRFHRMACALIRCFKLPERTIQLCMKKVKVTQTSRASIEKLLCNFRNAY